MTRFRFSNLRYERKRKAEDFDEIRKEKKERKSFDKKAFRRICTATNPRACSRGIARKRWRVLNGWWKEGGSGGQSRVAPFKAWNGLAGIRLINNENEKTREGS